MSTSCVPSSGNATPTIYLTILPTTTLSTAIRTTTSPPSSGALTGTGLATGNPTLTTAGVTQSSVSVLIAPTSQTIRQHVIIIVLVAVIAFVLLFFVVFYLFRRFRLVCKLRQNELEEGKCEVSVSRSIWGDDESSKKVYHTSREVGLDPSIPKPLPPILVNNGVVAQTTTSHPLWSPGIKRSRTLSDGQRTPSTPQRPPTSHRSVTSNRPVPPNAPASTLASYQNLQPQPKPMIFTAATTMQTRRSETPEPLYPIIPVNRGPSSAPVEGRQIKSFWSSSPTNSIGQSSPSLYSYAPPFPTNDHPEQSLRPPPTTRDTLTGLYSTYGSRSPEPHLTRTGLHRPSAVEHEDRSEDPVSLKANSNDTPKLEHETPRDDSPTLDQQTMRLFSMGFTFNEDHPHALPLPPVSPPSPRSPNRRSRTPPPSRSPLEATSPFWFETIAHRDEAPMNQIEKWLHGSTGTVSAFGSILDDSEVEVGMAIDGPRRDPSPLGSHPVSVASGSQGGEGSDGVRKASLTPSLVSISPIRQMRSSSSRRRSREG